MKIIRYLFFGILMVVFIACMFLAGREISYSLSYEDMVKETIREMVIEDYLK